MPATKKTLDDSNIGQAEEEAAAEVRKMVMALEKAIDAWEKSGHQPPELGANFDRYNSLLQKLREWESSKPEGAFEARLGRLRALADLRKVL